MFEPTFEPQSIEELRAMRDKLDRAGLKLVFTNGCFDLLHTGHVRYLQQARDLGDALVVALNSDTSVQALKGPERPIHNENDRAEIIGALRCVDGVTVFSTQRVTSLIEQIRPHIYAKGGDYTIDSLDPGERGALEAVGSEIRILPLVPGRSTTDLINAMASPPPEATPPLDAPLRIAVLGSGAGSNLQAIFQAIRQGACHAEIVTTISDQAHSGFVSIARSEKVACHLIEADDPPSPLSTDAQHAIAALLDAARVDVVVLAGFMRLIKDPVLSAYRGRIVNVHPSLLPKFKGLNAVQRAIDEGELETGCTLHLVEAAVDDGEILAQAVVPIQVGDTQETLHWRIKQEEHQLLPHLLNEWRARNLPTAHQH